MHARDERNSNANEVIIVIECSHGTIGTKDTVMFGAGISFVIFFSVKDIRRKHIRLSPRGWVRILIGRCRFCSLEEWRTWEEPLVMVVKGKAWAWGGLSIKMRSAAPRYDELEPMCCGDEMRWQISECAYGCDGKQRFSRYMDVALPANTSN
jgi:hypothetical protein